RRHGDDKVLGLATVAVGRFAAPAVVGAPVLAIDDVGEAVGTRHGAHDDVAAVAAVAAVGPALRYVLLPPETATARPAVAPLHENRYAIHKDHDDSLCPLPITFRSLHHTRRSSLRRRSCQLRQAAGEAGSFAYGSEGGILFARTPRAATMRMFRLC